MLLPGLLVHLLVAQPGPLPHQSPWPAALCCLPPASHHLIQPDKHLHASAQGLRHRQPSLASGSTSGKAPHTLEHEDVVAGITGRAATQKPTRRGAVCDVKPLKMAPCRSGLLSTWSNACPCPQNPAKPLALACSCPSSLRWDATECCCPGSQTQKGLWICHKRCMSNRRSSGHQATEWRAPSLLVSRSWDGTIPAQRCRCAACCATPCCKANPPLRASQSPWPAALSAKFPTPHHPTQPDRHLHASARGLAPPHQPSNGACLRQNATHPWSMGVLLPELPAAQQHTTLALSGLLKPDAL